MYRWLMAIGIAGLALISGCNNQSIIEGNHSIQKPKDEKEEIIVWHTYSEEETRVFENEVIPSFEKQYPQLDIRPVRQSYNVQLNRTLLARASAKEPPDVVRMDITWLPLFAKNALIYPVSDFKDFENIKEGLLESPLNSNLYKGNYYGLPLNTNTKAAIYNRKRLKEVGYSKPPSNMNELLNLVKNHDYRIGLTGFTTWETLPYFYGFGGTLLSPDQTKANGFLNSKRSIQAVEKLKILYDYSGKDDIWQGVVDGDYFMMDEGPWFYSVQNPQKIEEITNQTISAPFPVMNGKGSVLGGENLVIMKGARNPEASWTFIKWMASPEPQELLLKTGLMPTVKGINIKDLTPASGYIASYIDGLENSFLRPQVANWAQIDEIYTNYIQMMILGRIGVKEGLDLAAKEMDMILLEEEG